MPCSYLIDTDGAFAELSAYGKVTKDEVIQRFIRMLNDPDWAPGCRVISDYTGADLRAVVPSDLDELLEVAIQMRSKFALSKFAIVVTAALHIALFRMWNLKGGENIMEMQCFGTRDEAYDWLNQTEIKAAGAIQ